MIPTRPASAGLLLAASAVLLSACAAAGPAPARSAPPVASETTAPAADITGWKIDGGGKYVTGTTVVCSPDDKIYLEDTRELASTANVPVTTMVLFEGQIGYGTVWPGDKVTTGITDGSGTYTMTRDAHGAPKAVRGTATVTWHDKTGSSTRPDMVSLTFTPVLNSGKCLGGG